MIQEAVALEVPRTSMLQLVKDADKRHARAALRHLVQTGVFPKARQFRCVDCGEPAEEWDHHLGYEPRFALTVLPRCKKCHNAQPHWIRTEDGPGFVQTQRMSDLQRFLAQVEVQGDCWIWVGQRDKRGLPTLRRGTRRHQSAARFAYESVHGRVATKVWPTLVCDNRDCVRPSHVLMGPPTFKRR